MHPSTCHWSVTPETGARWCPKHPRRLQQVLLFPRMLWLCCKLTGESFTKLVFAPSPPMQVCSARSTSDFPQPGILRLERHTCHVLLLRVPV